MALTLVHRKPIASDLDLPTLIGLTGLAGSGKDTAGQAVLGWFGKELSHESFARPLKAMLAAMLQVDIRLLEGITEASRQWRELEHAEFKKTPRELMLSLGTEWGRDLVHPDLWVILAKEAHSRNKGGSLFTDVRFDNEAQWINDCGGVVIEIMRDGTHWKSVAAATHRSEAGVASGLVNAVVNARGGDIEGLQRGVCDALQELGVTPCQSRLF